jgi:pimeloyl-ACP methyl ester carboxylesterase
MQTHLFENQQISHHNKNLSFKTAGTGQAIVLFHSLLADQSSWDLITPALLKTHQVIQLSLPGFDSSDFVGGSLDEIADQIADLTPRDRERLGRILVHEYSLETCELKDGIDDGFITLEKELELV